MQGIIQVAIGMIFVFSLLSVLVTTLNSVVTNVLQWRAKHLKAAIETLITDQSVQQLFLQHPLINIVNSSQAATPQAQAASTDPGSMALGKKDPSINPVNYIDAKTFAQVLSSILAEKSAIALYGPLDTAISGLPDSPSKQHLREVFYALQNTGAGLNDLRTAVLTLPAEQQAPVLTALKALEDRGAAAQLASSDGSRLLPVLDGLRQVNDNAFRQALQVIVTSAQTIDQAQTNLANWFDQRMSQLSDVYKHNLTLLTLALGLILALVLNADSLQIARSLWEDSSLRDTVNTIVQTAASNGTLAQQASQAVQAQQVQQSMLTATPAPGGVAAEAAPVTSDAVAETTSQITNALTQISSLNLPIGWEFTPIALSCFPQKPVTIQVPATATVEAGAPTTVPLPATVIPLPLTSSELAPAVTEAAPSGTGTGTGTVMVNKQVVPPIPAECNSQRNLWLLLPGNSPNGFGLIILKILGVAITVIAIGQGAPFWFDLIRRLVNPTG